jgi:hypothetical protein
MPITHNIKNLLSQIFYPNVTPVETSIMSTNPASSEFVCVGDGKNHSSGTHRFQTQHPVTLLKKNAESGCPLCGLIYSGLLSYHGGLIKDHLPRLQFSRFASFNASMRVDIFLPGRDVENNQLEFVYMRDTWEYVSFLALLRMLVVFCVMTDIVNQGRNLNRGSTNPEEAGRYLLSIRNITRTSSARLSGKQH